MSYDPNEMMLELFRAEVESHSESLTSSLLKLEQDPADKTLLDGMMRAAHSIKGAARIVGVDAAVEIAHGMEDCFVAAQRGELELRPAGIDILLRALDLLGQVSEASRNAKVDWESFRPATHTTIGQIKNVLEGRPVVVDNDLTIPAPPPTQSPSEISSNSIPFQLDSPSPVVEMQPPVPMSDFDHRNRPIVLPATLDVSNSETVRLQLLAALEGHPDEGQVIIDFSQMEDLDCVGLALMHSVTKFAAMKNRQLRLERVSSTLSRIFKAVGIESHDHHPDVGNKGPQDGK